MLLYVKFIQSYIRFGNNNYTPETYEGKYGGIEQSTVDKWS